LRSSDHGGQFCRPPWLFHWSGNCPFRYCVMFLVKCWGTLSNTPAIGFTVEHSLRRMTIHFAETQHKCNLSDV
jgi:hypothetical protein